MAFFPLPAELRNRIIHAVIPHNQDIVVPYDEPLLEADPRIRWTYGPAFYRNNRFRYIATDFDFTDLIDWLDDTVGNLLPHLRHLEIEMHAAFTGINMGIRNFQRILPWERWRRQHPQIFTRGTVRLFGRAWSMYAYLRGMHVIPRMRTYGFSEQMIEDILAGHALASDNLHTQHLRIILARLADVTPQRRATRSGGLPTLIGNFAASLRHHVQEVPLIIAPNGPHGHCAPQNAVPG